MYIRQGGRSIVMVARIDPDVSIQSQRGRVYNIGLHSLAAQSLSTDPIGTFVLMLTNVVTGSAIQIESQDGTTTLHNSTAAGSTVVINLSAYAAGSSLNNLRIKIRKGSAEPYYQPYETLTTAVVGSQTIYVSQIPD